MPVNERLKSYRKIKGWSQSTIAEKAGIKRATYGFFEKGTNSPRFEFLINIYKNCPDLNYHWLITGEGDMFKKEKIKDADKDRMIEILNKYAEAGLTDPDELEMFLENTIGLALRIAKKQKKGKGMHESDSTAGTGGED